MARGRRKASFVGSTDWAKQDVEVVYGKDRVTAKDKPSGISVTRYGDVKHMPPPLAELAHRVKQLAF